MLRLCGSLRPLGGDGLEVGAGAESQTAPKLSAACDPLTGRSNPPRPARFQALGESRGLFNFTTENAVIPDVARRVIIGR